MQERARCVEPREPGGEGEGERRARRLQVRLRVVEQLDDMGKDSGFRHNGYGWRGQIDTDVDGRAIGIARDDHLEEVERLDRLGEAPHGFLLRVAHCGNAVGCREHHVRIEDVAIGQAPKVTAKRGATAVEGSHHHFGHEAGIGRIEVVGFSAHDPEQRYVPVLRRYPGPCPDQQPGGGGRNLGPRRVVQQVVQCRRVQVRYIEILAAGGKHQPNQRGQKFRRSHGSSPRKWPHGQNPRSIENQKLRLGGNGVTSMFRAIGWLPKLLTSGSSPVNGAIVKRLRALALRRT